MTTETETLPATTGTGNVTFVRHIVSRNPAGGHADQTLCGVLWDRINPVKGEICEACVEEYRRIRPGWPLPGGGS